MTTIAMGRRALLAASAVLGAMAVSRLARAWPDRSVRIIVPFAPGGGTDLTARIIANALAPRLGQPVLVENRPGAGGAIGMAAAAQAPADGYTLAMGHISTLVVNMAVQRNPGYNTARDFVALGITSTAANILVVNPLRSPGLRSVADFVATARSRPGQLSYGSAGVGSPAHITTELFLRTAGVEALHVPYRGGAPATTDLVAGNLDFMFSGASDCLPHVRSERLRALGIASVRRLASAADIPTIAESGYPDFAFEVWHALVARAGTPAPALDRLREATAAVLESAEVRDRVTALGVDATPMVGAAAAEHVSAELARWVPPIRAAGISVD